MRQRLLNPSKTNSYFVFGPRGSGKTTWIKSNYTKNALYFDLLDSKTDFELKKDPSLWLKQWLLLEPRPDTIIIDEIQKNPNLLDEVHKAIEEHKVQIILTGSSARKLKRGASNLLAGRAFESHLHPFSFFEIQDIFDLNSVLHFGLLPKLFSGELFDPKDKERYLYSYVSVYMREEILQEQIIRQLDPFQKFLEAAAQSNGKIVNCAKIGRDAGIDPKQVERYFPILSETLIGFFLEPYHSSIRKRQMKKSKFYFFDMGVVRTLQNRVSLPPLEGTSEFGDLFEHFIILEFFKLNHYLEKHFKISYFCSKDSGEIDLIIEKPGGDLILVEIKSNDRIDMDEVKKLRHLSESFKHSKFLSKELIFLSRDKTERAENGVKCLYWQTGLRQIFGIGR